MNETTEALAQFAATLRYDDIPEWTRAACKGLLLDAHADGPAQVRAGGLRWHASVWRFAGTT